MKIIQELFMHSLPHEIFISCQIFVPSTVTPCDVLIHLCVALDVGGGTGGEGSPCSHHR